MRKIVIIGGGFGGLYAAKTLGNTDTEVTLVDRRNFHLFQPLLYQVATGGLSPGDIAAPIRATLQKYKNITVLMDEMVDLDVQNKYVVLKQNRLKYDFLIIATGAQTSYYSHPEWANLAPGLKSIEDALEIRKQVLSAFESAEKEADPQLKKAWLTFVVAGGGPTGVELAGALGELAGQTLKNDFRTFDPADARIVLIEGSERILRTFPEKLSRQAKQDLSKLCVTVRQNTLVKDVRDDSVVIESNGEEATLHCKTVLWAAGIQGNTVANILHKRTGIGLDRMNRVPVQSNLLVTGNQNIFVIGDLARFETGKDATLPSNATVAMQQGNYVGALLRKPLNLSAIKPFEFRPKGNLAVIGRNAAVAQIKDIKLTGFVAWVIWILVHLRYLVQYQSKVLVLIQWALNYVTRKRGARLITQISKQGQGQTWSKKSL